MATAPAGHGRLWKEDLEALKAIQHPVVLVPTRAQLARGQRVIDATDDQCPSQALSRRKLALEHGWLVRMTYAHALMPPPRGKEDWPERHSIILRVEHLGRRLRGYGAWANAAWDGGQVGTVAAHGWVDLLTIRAVGSDEFGYLLQGVDPPEVVKAACEVCRREGLRVKKDGTLYLHKWLDGSCPGRRNAG